MQNESIEATAANGLTIRVGFHWLGDRFGHVISAVHPSGEIRPLLQSIEGAATDAWPRSPPLQSLSIETLKDGRRAALLVGMAGGSHWSASIEATQDCAELIFDLACRHTKQPEWLGSRYQRLSESRHVLAKSHEDSVVATPTAITVAPRTVVAAGTTRWKFNIQLLTIDH